jgi:hypothetical protein
MTSIAVTASKCANASEVALLVACFMPFLPRPGLFRPGRDSSLHANAQRRSDTTRNTPRFVFALRRPHVANIECAKVEQ